MKKKHINIVQRTLKDGSVKYYAGRRYLTDREKKDFFRSQVESAGFEADRLSAADRKLFGRIKGGLAASDRATRLSNGQIVKRNIAKAAKKLGVDLEAGLKATGYKTLKELEEKKPEFFKELYNYLDTAKMANWYRVKDAKANITDFRGKDIFLNGKKVSRSTAKNAISEFNQALLHKLGSDAYQGVVKLNFSGIDKLEFSLPDIDDIGEDISVSEFMELYGDDENGMYQIHGSPTPAR